VSDTKKPSNEISIKLNKRFVFGTLFIGSVIVVSGFGYHYISNNIRLAPSAPTPIVQVVAEVVSPVVALPTSVSAATVDTFVSGITPIEPAEIVAIAPEPNNVILAKAVISVSDPTPVEVSASTPKVEAPVVISPPPVQVAVIKEKVKEEVVTVEPIEIALPVVSEAEEEQIADLTSLLTQEDVVSDEDNRPLPTTELGDYKYLADSYDKGIGVKASPERAFFWHRKAAQKGDVAAQHQTASCYLTGKGVTQDIEKGIFWYEKAAKAGYAPSQHNLGAHYERSGDYTNALKYYKMSANQDFSADQFNMAVFYLKGQGVKQNKEEGLKWLRKAAINGDKQALKILAGV